MAGVKEATPEKGKIKKAEEEEGTDETAEDTTERKPRDHRQSPESKPTGSTWRHP